MIAGRGAVEALASAPAGTVIAAFSQATYLRFPAGVVALTAPGVPLGPLHVRSGLDRSGLGKGAVFRVPPRWPASLAVWRGELPSRHHVDHRLLAAVAAGSALLTEPYRERWRAAAQAGDLGAACLLLGGLGPGLTPSGDDALAGMLLAARILRPSEEGLLVALAAAVATHEISRAFLRWAAKGQSVEPVHRLLAGEAAAAGELRAMGHTSGADLALGLALGLGVTAPWPGNSASVPPVGCSAHPEAGLVPR